MSRLFRRRRWVDAAWITRLENEVLAQRDIIADLGRRLHAAQRGPLGDTVPQPRVRSLQPDGKPQVLLTDYSIGPRPRPHAGQ